MGSAATRFVPWKDLLLDIAGPHVPTLAEAIQSYSEVEARDLKPNTWSQRKRALKEFAEAIGGDHPVSEISKRMASTWSDGLIKEGKSKVYAANCVSHVAQLFDALERKDVASDNPVRGLIVVKKKEKAALRSKSLYRPENEAVWASFRQLRKAAQFSQEEFGQRLGRNQSYVSAAETGVIRLDALQIREWCQAAGTDMRTWLAVLEAQLAAVAVVEEGIPPR